MRQIAIFAALVLLGVYVAYGQQPEWTVMHSEEFYFIADFPGQSKESSGEIDTKFGKAPSKRWSVERPGMLYEVSVSEFSDLSVKMDSKSLKLFYDAVCSDLIGNCSGLGGNDQFGESGRIMGVRTKKESVTVLMYLARKRFYLTKGVMNNSLEDDEQTHKDVEKFLDSFLFFSRKEGEKKYTLGLPASASQNLEDH